MTEWLAIYAAAVGSGSLGWQIYRETRRLKTSVRVVIEHSLEPEPAPFVVSGGGPPPPPRRLLYLLAVDVINDGETTEYVRDAWIEDAAGTGGIHPLRDDREPGHGDRELPPRGRVRAMTASIDGFPVDLSDGFYAYARLTSHDVPVRSVRYELDDHLFAQSGKLVPPS